MSRRIGIVVLAFAAVSALAIGCSSDDLENTANAQAVEAGLNDVLAGTVEPLYSLLGAVPDLAGAILRGGMGGVVVSCPAGNPCVGGGTEICSVTGSGTSLTFDFNECVVVTGDGPITLDGGLVVTPGVSIDLDFNSLFINNSPAMSGSGSVTPVSCAYVVNVSTTDPASVAGTIVQCDGAPYPEAGSFLTITIGDYLLNITFDGSSIGHATASSGGNFVADCSIDLDLSPPTANCSAP